MWRLFVLSVCLVGGAQVRARAAPAAAAEDFTGCILNDHHFSNHRMSLNETFNTGPDPCNTYSCVAPNQWTALTCAWFTAGEGCEVVPGDPTAVYPGCCPDISCNANVLGVDEPHVKGTGSAE